MWPHRERFLPQKQLSHPSQQVVHTQLNLRLTHWMCPTQVGGWPNRPLHPRASFPIWFSMWLWGREGCRQSSEQTQSDKVNSWSAADIFTSKFCSEGLGEFALSPSTFWDSGAPTTPHYREIPQMKLLQWIACFILCLDGNFSGDSTCLSFHISVLAAQQPSHLLVMSHCYFNMVVKILPIRIMPQTSVNKKKLGFYSDW